MALPRWLLALTGEAERERAVTSRFFEDLK